MPKGGTAVLWGGGAAVPDLSVAPKAGCPSQTNFFGGGVVPENKTRGPAAAAAGAPAPVGCMAPWTAADAWPRAW